ncbi:MAG: ABC transporter ATP-binding protein, partial [Actinobacteria bacterium]|nr:ABC transporter ATP-binding protein [Actinomycetota bacterium]NIS34580.1 ABC transporter ATP-binding protein [Actinomycetota bacterium]NIT94184.1 ABC transporter ATP-binding protein [Actinomycetota bacterium]NIU21259.1 ABC transporter ATP-binding protein [Actinomycetota bacterium]NIU64269.1 ABC transporter ATP-binding protein [Actinomycetota bacterium]
MPASAASPELAAPATRPSTVSRYPQPRRGIDPDRARGWLRRVWPVVWVQRRIFVFGVIAGFLSTAATVLVPVTVGGGIDAITDDESPTPFVLVLAILAAARFGFGFLYRFSLFRAAHTIESDLRNLIYEKLTALSFGYWDRIQSGQVISRANTDIRSIQLLFAFGPLIAMQLVLLVVALVVMLLIDVPLTLIALSPLPLVFLVGVRLRNRIFPLSWV